MWSTECFLGFWLKGTQVNHTVTQIFPSRTNPNVRGKVQILNGAEWYWAGRPTLNENSLETKSVSA